MLTVGFGVSFAVLLPMSMTEPWYRLLGNNPLWGPFWGVFGSFDVSGPLALEKAVATDGGLLVEQLEPTTTLTPILLWIYQFVAAIILINLLIAQMADTYGRVTADGLVRWQFERAALISEYKDTKPPLPPPANLLCVAYNLLQWLLAKFCPGLAKEQEVSPGFQKVRTFRHRCSPCATDAHSPPPASIVEGHSLHHTPYSYGCRCLTPCSCAFSSGASIPPSRSACGSAPRRTRSRPRPRPRSSG